MSADFSFETHPSRYKHWRLEFSDEAPEIVTLVMDVDEAHPLRPGYVLKLNSYDLGVDIELADAVNRVRFEHPEVKVVVVTSGNERAFCAGANIPMLASSSHAWKVNFCKFTNETRLAIEDASARSGIRFLAALNGATAGGGYELALACDEIVLIDDGSSAVSLPEVPLLGVLPGTGGLTRLVDKRKVRRDHADMFCTLAEGVRGKRALEWKLVDAVIPKSKWKVGVLERAKRLASTVPDSNKGPKVELPPLEPRVSDREIAYKYVRVELDPKARVASLFVHAPDAAPPKTAEEIRAQGAAQWSLRAFRELDDAMLRLRMHHMDIGLVVLKTRGDIEKVLEADAGLHGHQDDWLAREIIALQSRVLRRIETSAKSFFAIGDEGSAFAGVLLELALLSDRFYMLNDRARPVHVAISVANFGAHPMGNGLSRLASRFLGEPEKIDALKALQGKRLSTDEAYDAGLVTVAPDELDWDDEVRVAIEERASLSPDALTGMEASLRFCGPETNETKIFGRLSAWQNWIFQRPNAVGETGALSLYGKPQRPSFDFCRC